MSVHAIRRYFNVSGSLLAAALVVGMSGCSMCCAPFDYDFPYTGGVWVRDNPCSGRVGSVIDPAGYKAIPDDSTPREGEPAGSGDDRPPTINNLDREDAPMPPGNAIPRGNDQMISTPRLRPVRNYLPQN
jgi:hypothetical protein